MSYRDKAITSAMLLALVYLLLLLSLGLAAAQGGLSINQLVTSGQTVTLQAPSGDYLYQWAAVTGGATIGQGSARGFSFKAPLVSQDESSKTVTVSLYIRTKEGGCVNQTSTDISVYSLPVCGIDGPADVGPYETATYTYTGGTTGKLTYEWNVDGKKINGATGPNVNVDWTQYDPINHTIGMTLTRDYSDVAPGSTSPFRSISCTFRTNVTYTTGLQVTKTASATTAAVGQAVTYSYIVQNTGTIGINSLALTDDKLGEIKLDTNTIMPGTQATGTSTYTIKESDLPGPLTNNVTASGVEDRTKKPVSASASATVDLTYNAALNLTKVPSSTTAKVGDKVTYRFTVTNTGNVTIKGLNLTDDKLGTIKTDKNELAPGAVTSASATHVILESDLPGPLINVATIKGTDSQNQPVTATATASIALTYTSGLAVTKKASSDTAKVGDTVTYQFSVKNNGSVTINGLALNDDKLGIITLDKTSLAPDETATGSATHTIIEADLPGPLTNVATASGTDSQGVAVTGQATASVELTYTASLQVTKTPSAQTANVGESVAYQFQVKNTGLVTISALALTDDKIGSITLDNTSLAPGETANGSATYTVVETNLPGPLTNVATVTGTDSQGVAVAGQATASVELTYTAALQVTKTPSVSTAAVGESVTYQFSVSNTGNVTINSLTLTDDKLGDITLNTALLAPGANATGSATHTVIETDLPGPLTNVATAKGTDTQGKSVTAQAKASVELTYTATMEVAKTPSVTAARVGESVTYNYTVRNTGTVTIKGLKLSDDKLKEIKVDKDTLASGETATGSATYTVVETDLPGPLTNVVTATAKDSVGKEMTSEAQASVDLSYFASMEIVKTPSSTTAKVGDTITYSYTVRNTGEVTLNDLALNDDKLGDVKIEKSKLAAGETATGKSTHLVVEGDLPGPLTNVVTGTATDSQGQPVTATATASVDLSYTAALTVTKEPSAKTAKIGDTVTYKFSIKNTGSVTIKALNLTDDKLGTITIDKDSLPAGEAATGSATHTVIETDLPGPLTNVATASGTDSQGVAVTGQATASVELTYTSALEVTKTPSAKTANVGESVTYQFLVKNTGSVTINALSLTDDKLGTITLDRNSLPAGETATGSATYTVVEADLPGPLANVASATGTDLLGATVSAQAKASVQLTYTAALQVTKTSSANTAAVGENVTYQFSVSNTGNVTINALTLTDDKLGDITLDTALLAAGATATGSATHTVIEADLPGPLTNVATAKGTDTQGKSVTAQAGASVDLTYAATMEVAKTPSVTTAKVGESVTYNYTVRNTGTVAIKGLKLSDDRLKEIKVDKDTLAAGETATGSATYTVVETDLPGPLTNVVTATAKDSVGKEMTAQARASVDLSYFASMEIVKTPSSTTAKVGDTITYSYTVRNTGEVTLNDLALNDDKLGDVKIEKSNLATGETATGKSTHLVVEGDLPGPLTNVVTGTATDSQGQPVTATATASVELNYTAALTVTKEPSAKTATIGDTVTYKFTVKNTGSVTVNGLTLTDDKLGAIKPEKDTLAPGESTAASIDHVVVESDLPSPLTNVVTAAATDVLRQPVTSTATASVALTYTANLEMAKVATPASAKVGETVTYTYTITNRGKVTIRSFVLTDDKLGNVAVDQKSVTPGGTATAKATYTIDVKDVPGPIINNALVEGKDPVGVNISAKATATVTITRDAITPTVTCVALNDDGTFTAFFGYSNPNSYAVNIEIGKENQFTPSPDGQGQPTSFKPGAQTAVFGVVSKGDAIVWHLDGNSAEANKNSGGCSQAGCGLDGPTVLCRNKEETYSYTAKVDDQFKQSYDWFMDDTPLGSGKSITISGSKFEMGEHKIKVKVNRDYKEMAWSRSECSMDVKVIPEPNADIYMEEEG